MNDQALLQAFLADHPDARRELYTYQLDDGTEEWGFTIAGTRAHTAWLLANDLCDQNEVLAILEELAALEAEPFGETPRRRKPREEGCAMRQNTSTPRPRGQEVR